MSRKDEYIEILKELDDIPVELDYTLTRAEARLKSKKRHGFFIIPLSSIATFLIVFTIIVNSSITFVEACARIPVLKDFAQLLIYSPSLSAAIENEYVQPMKLEQSKNDITARVEYVIVDQKQLNIFYSLDSKVYTDMAVRPDIKALHGKPLEGYSLSSNSLNSNGELNHIRVDFMDTDIDMPSGIDLNLRVSDRGHLVEEEAVNVVDGLLTRDHKDIEPNYIGEFNFKLEFDPYYTLQGEAIILNQEFEIDNQILTLASVEIYPSHIRLNFADDENNTAWPEGFESYIENERGERYEGISNGITGSGSVDSPIIRTHRLESSFFSKSENLTLYIKGVTWLDKNMEKVKFDLENKTIEALPETVALEDVKRKGGSWLLKFSAEETGEGGYYQLWGSEYYDEKGEKYHINSSSASSSMAYNEETQEYTQNPGRFDEEFALVDYPYDIVYLCPSYSRIVDLTSPIEIKIK